MGFQPGHKFGNRFQHGNRIRAGLRRSPFTETQLRRPLVLPAVRQFYVFCRVHRDRIPLEQMGEETGATLSSLYSYLSRARSAIGMEKLHIRYNGAARPRWAVEESLHVCSRPNVNNHFYAWNDQIEAAAREYFLTTALHRFEIARLLWIEKLSYTEVARKMRVAQHEARNVARAVYKIAAGKKRQWVYHQFKEPVHDSSLRPSTGKPAGDTPGISPA
jgi:hypothetical protein